MGNAESLAKICGGKKKPKTPNAQDVNENPAEEGKEEIQDFDDGGLIENNRDSYFTKDDYEKIIKKFPDAREWQSQDMATSKIRKRQKRINLRWNEIEVIGNGSFGQVLLGLNALTGSFMAVKQVKIGASNTQAQQERIRALEMELEVLSQLNHKNIVRYYGSERTKTTFNIFLEYIPRGTIASHIEKYGPIKENLIKVYTKQILEGLEYLHVRNIIHRDIKGANVLVDDSAACKLADFGTAKRISTIVDGEAKYMPSLKGTVNWMAPEVIKQASLGRYSDIWSVGCTVLEMVTGKMPWAHLAKPGSNPLAILYQIAQSNSPPPIPEGLSAEASDFLRLCFKVNPTERPNVIKLLQHKFITSAPATIERPLPTPEDKKKTMQFPATSPTHRKSGSASVPSSESLKPRAAYAIFRKEFEEGGSTSQLETLRQRSQEPRERSEEPKGNRKPDLRLKVDRDDKNGTNLLSTPIRPKFTLRSLNDVNNQSSNIDQFSSNHPSKPELDDKLLKGERYISTPEGTSNFEFNFITDHNRLATDNKYELMTSPGRGGSAHLDPLEIDPIPSSRNGEYKLKVDTVPHTMKKRKSRPLGNGSSRQLSVAQGGGDEDGSGFISTLGDVSRKTSEQVNLKEDFSSHPRRISQFGKEGNNSSDKDIQASINERVEEPEHDKFVAAARKQQNGDKSDKKHENDLKNFGLKHLSSNSQDSDIDSNINLYINHKLTNSSTKTFDISDATAAANGTNKPNHEPANLAVVEKRESYKFSPMKNVLDAVKEVQRDSESQHDISSDVNLRSNQNQQAKSAKSIRFTENKIRENNFVDKTKSLHEKEDNSPAINRHAQTMEQIDMTGSEEMQNGNPINTFKSMPQNAPHSAAAANLPYNKQFSSFKSMPAGPGGFGFSRTQPTESVLVDSVRGYRTTTLMEASRGPLTNRETLRHAMGDLSDEREDEASSVLFKSKGWEMEDYKGSGNEITLEQNREKTVEPNVKRSYVSERNVG